MTGVDEISLQKVVLIHVLEYEIRQPGWITLTNYTSAQYLIIHILFVFMIMVYPNCRAYVEAKRIPSTIFGGGVAWVDGGLVSGCVDSW